MVGAVKVRKKVRKADRKPPWARLRIHGPCMIFDWHKTEGDARAAIDQSVTKYGDEVFQAVAYFPDMCDVQMILDEALTEFRMGAD